MANSDDEPDDVNDFGFNNPLSYVMSTGQIFVQSRFIVMPNAGGWDDQDAAWCDDMLVYLKGLSRQKWEFNQSKKSDDDPAAKSHDDDDITFPDWKDYA